MAVRPGREAIVANVKDDELETLEFADESEYGDDNEDIECDHPRMRDHHTECPECGAELES